MCEQLQYVETKKYRCDANTKTWKRVKVKNDI